MSASAEWGPVALRAVYRQALPVQPVDERMCPLLISGRLAAVHDSPRGQEIVSAGIAVQEKIILNMRGQLDRYLGG